jgi:hypothetical protein
MKEGKTGLGQGWASVGHGRVDREGEGRQI